MQSYKMSSALYFVCVISMMISSMVKADQDGKMESESRGMTEEGSDVMHSSSRAKRSDDLGAVEATLSMMSQRLNQLEAAQQATRHQITERGSTFIRWGRSVCPSNTQLVYSGFSGGKHFQDKGSGTNRLCLTRAPQFDSLKPTGALGRLHGTEYYSATGLIGHNVPCAVCRTPLSTTITVPGTLTCPQGWTTQFKGHIMSTHYTDHFATEYVCGDEYPTGTSMPGENAKNYGNLFEYTFTVCGSLSCPPYQNNRVVTCVVCSL